MAYTFQDLIDVTSTASGTTLTQSRTYAAHDRVVVWVRYANLSGTSVASISDGTNTYTRIGTTFTDATTASIYDAFECKDCAAGTFTLTYTLTVAETFRTMAIVRYSGLDNTTTTLVARQLQNSTAPSSGNLTPGSQPGALIGLAYNDSTSNAITADTGAGFTSRGTLANEDTAFSSASRVEDRRLTATTAVAATFAGTATDNIIVYGFFIPEAATAADQPPQAECGDNWEATSLAEIEGTDIGPWDWYQDNTVPNRAGVEPPIPERLPEAFEWVDPNEADEALYQWPWGNGPPPADVDTYVYDQTIHDSSTQLEDVDEPFAFDIAPLPANLAADQIWADDASTQLEDVDEDFGFTDAPLAASVSADFIQPELGNDQPDEQEFLEGFRDDPLPEDIFDQLFNEFGHFDDPADESADEGWFVAPMDTAAQVDDSSVAQEYPQSVDDEDAPEGFDAQPLAADNDVSAACVFSDQAEEPEDESFGFDVQPQPDDVQSDQVFAETGDWWPDDVVEEPEGFTCDPTVPELVIEEPLPDCEYPDQAEEPEDEDFGLVDAQTPDDVIPPPVDAGVVISGPWATNKKTRKKKKEDEFAAERADREYRRNLLRMGVYGPRVTPSDEVPQQYGASTQPNTYLPPDNEPKPLPKNVLQALRDAEELILRRKRQRQQQIFLLLGD